MPYIRSDRRRILDEKYWEAATPGELNYLITNICTEYAAKHTHGYAVYNDIIGALECAKQEFYRRVVVPYEDIKIKENGDVY